MESKKETLEKNSSFVTKMFNNKPQQYVVMGLLFLLIPIINLWTGFISFSSMTLINNVVIFAIAALGFNILLGYAGQVSLGHAAFMGMGAYLSAFLTMRLELPFLLALLISGLVPMVIGLLLGLVALRLERLYLAIATLGLGVTFQNIFIEWTSLTGGHAGLRRIPYPEIFGITIQQREHYLILSTIILVLLSIFAYNFLNSKTGRALVAMRDSEHAAQAMGISLFKYKLYAFALSAFYVGIAGSLYAHLYRYVEPSAWGVDLSLNLLAMVVIGGLASIGGSIIGAAFIQLLPRIMQDLPIIGGITNINFILTGVALIVVIVYFPAGLIRRFEVLWNKVKVKVKLGQ